MKVGLITPYWGTNLGDAAIQEAVIHNIRKRYSDAEICLISLNPEYTSRLHKIASFPITALTIRHYSHANIHVKTQPYNASTPDRPGSVKMGFSIATKIKSYIKKIPKFFYIIKCFYMVFLMVIKVPCLIYREISHFIEGRRFVKGASLLIVSGGGQLDDYWGGPWGHPYSLLKWGIISRTISARYVFLGVGTCALESKLSSFFIRQALRMASYRSYRDLTSKKLLEEMPFTQSDLVGPDLAFSYDKSQLAFEKLAICSENIIGISPITYLRRNWPKTDSKIYTCYLENIVKFIASLVEHGYSIHLFITDESDRHGVEEIFDLLLQKNNIDISKSISQICTGTTEELFTCLNQVNYVVASRLHGVILGHLMQKPVLAISYDRKVDTHMNDTGFSDYCLDIHSADLDSMKSTFDALVANSQLVTSTLKVMSENYAHQLDHQYDHVLGTSNE